MQNIECKKCGRENDRKCSILNETVGNFLTLYLLLVNVYLEMQQNPLSLYLYVCQMKLKIGLVPLLIVRLIEMGEKLLYFNSSRLKKCHALTNEFFNNSVSRSVS